MKKFYLCIALCLLRLAVMAQTYWQQELHYTIDVTLNDQDHTLDGFLKLRYFNHSPDTLSFIWFHLWPNAFKNDRTAFSEQTVENGRIDFYFSSREERGYINRLDFRIDNNTLKTEDHPQYIDIVKVLLPAPLAPGTSTEITTPFHVQLPKNFSRGGHTGNAYQITQWYPKPAVYDRFGWHPMPYLDQGEFYSDFGNYDVRITVPGQYVVAATGEERESSTGSRESAVVKRKTKKKLPAKPVSKHLKPSRYAKKPTVQPVEIVQPAEPKVYGTKTIRYVQNDIHDFAWFADTAFEVKHDTIQLPSGRVVEAFSYYYTHNSKAWQNSIQYIKDAVRFRSKLIGEYPYKVVKVVEAKMGFEGGMEYPTITSLSPGMDEKSLDGTIEHEVGHNWFYGILASNERSYPWMDEGINSYYDSRYKEWKYPAAQNKLHKKFPQDPSQWTIDVLAKIKKDQPVATSSADFNFLNYAVIAYGKTSLLFRQMEAAVGRERFDSCMQAYYKQWQFKHPYPQDLQSLLQSCTQKDLTPFFEAMQKKGPVTHYTGPKKIKPAFLFSFKDYERTNYLNWLPVMGYNMYDGFMIGLGFHNYTLPSHNFQFFLTPMYATGSKQFNGIGRLGYTWRPEGAFQKIELAVAGSRFSTREGTDSNSNKLYTGFYKIAPSLRLTFDNASPRSSREKWLEWKTYIIGEQSFRYVTKQSDGESYPTKGVKSERYLNQLSFNVADYRALYPYDVLLQIQQGDGFYRASAEGHYFFNYDSKGGLQMRVFAAKFGYIGEKTFAKEIRSSLYQPKLTAVRGNEDYTYSDYFIGRNEPDGLASQQIMIRDGGLKLRTDLFQGLQGQSDNWIAAMNLNTTLPRGLLPLNFPLRIFLDVGTYAEAWKKNAATSRFLYVGGLQLSLFRNLLNIYAPIVYSKEFKDVLKTVPEENKFGKKISFSIDVHRFNLRRVTGNKIPF